VSKKPSILIVEDDPATGEVLLARLKLSGYEAQLKSDGLEGFEAAVSGTYDLIVLDVMLPGMNGFDILERLREKKIRAGILMLTARADFEARIKGLESGADDYLAKPFDPREVMLRVKNLLQSAEARSVEIEIGDITLNKKERTVTRGGVSDLLTDREYDLLLYLMEHAGDVISKETLIKEVWKSDFERDPNIVNVYLSYVRKKLSRKGLPLPLETVHGLGVRLIVPKK
jgi:two-component system copper resistance phosphate regulon response regulator CusR